MSPEDIPASDSQIDRDFEDSCEAAGVRVEDVAKHLAEPVEQAGGKDEISDKVTDSLVAFVTAPDAQQKMDAGFFVCTTCGQTVNRANVAWHPCYIVANAKERLANHLDESYVCRHDAEAISDKAAEYFQSAITAATADLQAKCERLEGELEQPPDPCTKCGGERCYPAAYCPKCEVAMLPELTEDTVQEIAANIGHAVRWSGESGLDGGSWNNRTVLMILRRMQAAESQLTAANEEIARLMPLALAVGAHSHDEVPPDVYAAWKEPAKYRDDEIHKLREEVTTKDHKAKCLRREIVRLTAQLPIAALKAKVAGLQAK